MRNLFSLFVFLCAAFAASTQAGTFNPNFGRGGYTAFNFGTGNYNAEYAEQVLVQPNGKLIAVLDIGFGVKGIMELVRYNRDGSLDSTFGTNGYTIPIRMYAGKALQQKNGKLVVVSTERHSSLFPFVLARFTADGRLDSTFGRFGIQRTSIGGSYDFAQAVALQKDDKIVVAGTTRVAGTSHDVFAVVRYTPDGFLDSTFSENGIDIPTFSNNSSHVSALAIQSDGKIVMAGSTYSKGQGISTLIRYNPDGSLDKRFPKTGFLTDFHINIAAMAIQEHDKILIAGGNNGDFMLSRYTKEGLPDSTFADNGAQITDLGKGDTPTSILLQADGRIVVAGYSNDNDITSDFAILRYNSNGTLDHTFSTDGIQLTSLEQFSQAYSVVQQPNGKLVAAGFTSDAEYLVNDDIGIARYNEDGSLDNSFAENGKLVTYIKSGRSELKSIAVQQDGKMVVAGYCYNASNSNFAVARINPDGTLDSSFAENGTATTDFGRFDYANAVAIQQDGKIVVAGVSTSRDIFFNMLPDTYFTLARYNRNGTLDSTFSGDGKLITSIGGQTAAIVIQKDGKIVVTGYTSSNYPYSGFILARFNTDGSYDNTFSGDGRVVSDEIRGISNSLAIQQDGKIVVGGRNKNGFGIARYNENGSLDHNFSQDGIQIAQFSDTAFDYRSYNYAQPFSISIQPDGKIILAGTYVRTTAIEGSQDFALALFNENGTLDSTFSNDALVSTDFSGFNDQANAVAIQSDGKIVAAGYSNTSSDYIALQNNNFALARYKGDGTLDSTFSNGGKQTNDFSLNSYAFGTDDRIYGAVINNGNLYVAGSIQNPTSTSIVASYQLGGIEVLLSCPDAKIVPTDKGVCTAVVNNIDPVVAGAIKADVTYTLSGATTGSGSGTASGKSFSKGITTVKYALAGDPTTSCSFIVTVEDREAPAITNVSTTPSVLWPPNHKLVDVAVSYTVSDNCGAAAMLSVSGTDGANRSDWQVVDAHHVRLRAERSGSGNGRTYTITITAADASGNKSIKTVNVVVPHDRSNKQKAGNYNDDMKVSVFPNPSQQDFTLQVQSTSDKPIRVRVSNAEGKLLEVRQTGTKNTLRLGSNYPAGIYFAEVVQGTNHLVVKLVKLRE